MYYILSLEGHTVWSDFLRETGYSDLTVTLLCIYPILCVYPVYPVLYAYYFVFCTKSGHRHDISNNPRHQSQPGGSPYSPSQPIALLLNPTRRPEGPKWPAEGSGAVAGAVIPVADRVLLQVTIQHKVDRVRSTTVQNGDLNVPDLKHTTTRTQTGMHCIKSGVCMEYY